MSIIFNATPPPIISEFGEPFYRSIEQAVEAMNKDAQPQGFAVSKRSTEPTRVRIQCARSKPYKAEKSTDRQSFTHSTECPYRANLRLHPDAKNISNHEVWHVQIIESGHNHDRQPGHTFAIHQTRQINRYRYQIIAATNQGHSPSIISQTIQNQCDATNEEYVLDPDRIRRFTHAYRQSNKAAGTRPQASGTAPNPRKRKNRSAP